MSETMIWTDSASHGEQYSTVTRSEWDQRGQQAAERMRERCIAELEKSRGSGMIIEELIDRIRALKV